MVWPRAPSPEARHPNLRRIVRAAQRTHNATPSSRRRTCLPGCRYTTTAADFARGVLTRSRILVRRLPAAYFGLSRTWERPTTSWRVLHNRSFRYYFAGSVTSDFGTWLQNTAQVLLAYRLSHSVLVVGLVTCAQFSSPLVLGPWAGVLTDRFGGRCTLLGTQGGAGVFAAPLA